MTQPQEIENIIFQFKKDYNNGKCSIIPRLINQNTLRTLGWIEEEALSYLESELKVEHYQSGPEPPHQKNGAIKSGSVWVFVMPIFSEKTNLTLEVYVKFNYCKDGTIFISFHESEKKVGVF